MVYKTIFLEQCGICNAKCPWCCTGNGSNKADDKWPSANIPAMIDLLRQKELMDENTTLHLYNWGEPTLSSSYTSDWQYLSNQKVKYVISSNMSVRWKFYENQIDACKQMVGIIISMPGFSQESYDRVHGFFFENIKQNLRKNIWLCRQRGFEGYVQISFHVYQFNQHEVQDAYDWATERGFIFTPSYAFINDPEMARNYLKNDAVPKILTKGLHLDYVDELLSKKPKDWRCPQFDILTVDEAGNVLTCCCLMRKQAGYSIGKLSAMSADEIAEKKITQATCKECTELGLAYWLHNSKTYTGVVPWSKIKTVKKYFKRLGEFLWS